MLKNSYPNFQGKIIFIEIFGKCQQMFQNKCINHDNASIFVANGNTAQIQF